MSHTRIYTRKTNYYNTEKKIMVSTFTITIDKTDLDIDYSYTLYKTYISGLVQHHNFKFKKNILTKRSINTYRL